MVTQTRWVRSVSGIQTYAFTARPDLWPPGSTVSAKGAAARRLVTQILASWACGPTVGQLSAWASAPGVAEALILAGQVKTGLSAPAHWTWSPW